MHAHSFGWTREFVACVISIVDYVFRWLTADYKLNLTWKSFVRYPFTFMAIIDLLSILPTLTLLSSGFKVLRVLGLFRTFRVFRVFKLFRYSKSIELIINVIKNQIHSIIFLMQSIGQLFH